MSVCCRVLWRYFFLGLRAVESLGSSCSRYEARWIELRGGQALVRFIRRRCYGLVGDGAALWSFWVFPRISGLTTPSHWARCARELSGAARRTRNCRSCSPRLRSGHRVEWRGFADVRRGLRCRPAAPCKMPRSRSKTADVSGWEGLWLRLDSEAGVRHLLFMIRPGWTRKRGTMTRAATRRRSEKCQGASV